MNCLKVYHQRFRRTSTFLFLLREPQRLATEIEKWWARFKDESTSRRWMGWQMSWEVIHILGLWPRCQIERVLLKWWKFSRSVPCEKKFIQWKKAWMEYARNIVFVTLTLEVENCEFEEENLRLKFKNLFEQSGDYYIFLFEKGLLLVRLCLIYQNWNFICIIQESRNLH